MMDELNKNLLAIYAEFPRIGRALELFWGEKEFPPYVNGLVSDSRSNRKGFPAAVLTAIIALQILHDEAFPQYIIENPNDWMSSQFGIR